MGKTELKPKISHWSAYILWFGFLVFGVLIGMTQLNIVEFDFIPTVTSGYFILAGIFLMLEASMEPGSTFRIPKNPVDIISLIVALVSFFLGITTFTKPEIPVEWTGVICLLAFIVAGDIGVEFFTD